jgi:CheY-like chemotaxis protein
LETQLPTILLVDDDQSILKAWSRILRFEGFHVETASDGVAGLAAAKKVLPSLIITDRLMPKMDGIELCRLLKSEPTLAAIPVILASDTHNIAFGAPVWDDFWQKPILADTMIMSIQRLLGLTARDV